MRLWLWNIPGADDDIKISIKAVLPDDSIHGIRAIGGYSGLVPGSNALQKRFKVRLHFHASNERKIVHIFSESMGVGSVFFIRKQQNQRLINGMHVNIGKLIGRQVRFPDMVQE